MKNLIGTVVYEQSNYFTESYFKALQKIEEEFYLLLLCEDYSSYQKVTSFIPNIKKNIIVKVSKNKKNYINLRDELLNEALKIEKWQNIYLLDFDDEISQNAIKIHSKVLDNFSISVGNMRLIDEKSNLLGPCFFDSNRIKSKITSSNQIVFKNIFGMTNTAFKRKTLIHKPKLKNNTIKAYDWWLFTKLLDNNIEAGVSNSYVTDYRVSQHSLLGWGAPYNLKRFKKELSIIHNHFSSLEANRYRKIAIAYLNKANNLINNEIKLCKTFCNHVWYYDFFKNLSHSS